MISNGPPAALASTYAAAGTSPSAPFTFGVNGSYTVYARIFDKDNSYTPYSTPVTVNNVAPIVVAGDDSSTPLGSYQVTGCFTDPGSETWTATVNYGDGGGVQPLALNPNKTFNLSHLYATPGDYPVTVTVTAWSSVSVKVYQSLSWSTKPGYVKILEQYVCPS